jgi:hypothetical protein
MLRTTCFTSALRATPWRTGYLISAKLMILLDKSALHNWRSPVQGIQSGPRAGPGLTYQVRKLRSSSIRSLSSTLAMGHPWLSTLGEDLPKVPGYISRGATSRLAANESALLLLFSSIPLVRPVYAASYTHKEVLIIHLSNQLVLELHEAATCSPLARHT